MRFFLPLLVLSLVGLLFPAGAQTSDAPAPPMSEFTPVLPPERASWDLPVQLDPKITIGKIYDFLNDPKFTKTGKDPVIKQEFRYFNYGAVTSAEKTERKGHYYIVNFTNAGPPADLIVRMDFRQLLSRDTVNTLEVPFKNMKGTGKQRFVIAGEMYAAYGDVNSWRIAIVRDGVIVAQKKSFVW